MTRRLLVSYLTITLFVLLVLEVPLGLVTARSERQRLVSQVKQDALVLTLLSEERLEGGEGPQLQQIADGYQKQVGGRVVIVDAAGNAVADSDPVDSGGQVDRNFKNRPEMNQALRGEIASGWRNSKTLRTDVVYVAVPVASHGTVIGALRVTYTAAVATRRIHRTWLVLAGIGVFILLVVLGVSLALARWVNRPIRRLETAAARLGAGDLEVRAPEDEGPDEVRLLAREFNTTADRLGRLIDGQRAFLADASHQLRTPLAALRLRLENLEAEVEGGQRADIEGALAEVRRLSRLIDALLALARAEHRPPAPVPTDLRSVVEERVASWAALADERDVRLEASLDGVREILAGPGTLEQVLDNLLSNAVEAAPPGTEVRVWARRADGRVEVHVVDHGPGMTPEERARAFDRFWQSPRTRAAGTGTGLGLAVVRQLVAAGGGTVELADTPGGGLDVVLRLPPSS